MNSKRNVRVSSKSEPSKVASSILYILESGENVEATALGNSVSVLTKSICLVSNLNNGRLNLEFIPRMTYVEDSYGITRSAVQFEIIVKR